MSQSKYAKYLLDMFQMIDCKASPTPFQSGIHLTDFGDSPLVDYTMYQMLFGSLLCLTHSRPDFSYEQWE
jgi:hypothetical protein